MSQPQERRFAAPQNTHRQGVAQPTSTSPNSATPGPAGTEIVKRPPQREKTASASVENSASAEMPEEQVGEAEGVWGSISPRRMLENMGACVTSTLFHIVVLLILALIAVPEVLRQEILPLTASPSTREDESEFKLEEMQIEPQRMEQTADASADSSSVAFASATSGEAGSVTAALGTISTPVVEATIAKNDLAANSQLSIDGPMIQAPPSSMLVQHVPDGVLGDPRAIVDNYDEAMDRLTRELLMLLDKHNLLVIWCFDQSESMKDDQDEIRARIERVYTELGQTGQTANGAMLSAVTSFGSGFAVHTKVPTDDVALIRQAIAAVPNDPTGKEMTCGAITQSLAVHQKWMKGRKPVLVLVTDESGEKEDSLANLELAIDTAKRAKCISYILGREATFGYPYAHMAWKHPQTWHVHYLPVDRGPETGFVEQLQTDGFRRRHDSFSSGFGPYEQCRLARETGGIFFMLPSIESAAVDAKERRYQLAAMRTYLPDLNSREQLNVAISKGLLRRRITEVVNELNPYNPRVQAIIEMRVHFSPDVAKFVQQVQEEKMKALQYIVYLDRAEQVFASEEMQYARQQEVSPRWQANYDLLYAQLLAYKVRTYEYGAYLEWFTKNPKVVPLTRPPNQRMIHWDITTRKETITGEQTDSLIEKSRELFNRVMVNHPGTPWAARAEWELQRGFGVELVPHYWTPPPAGGGGPAPKPIPIPKL